MKWLWEEFRKTQQCMAVSTTRVLPPGRFEAFVKWVEATHPEMRICDEIEKRLSLGSHGVEEILSGKRDLIRHSWLRGDLVETLAIPNDWLMMAKLSDQSSPVSIYVKQIQIHIQQLQEQSEEMWRQGIPLGDVEEKLLECLVICQSALKKWKNRE